ncbi:MAG: DUF2188 domain-containing protein [Candidatus Peregrinibacteria bacterium]
MNKRPLPRRNLNNPAIREYDRAVRRGQESYHVVPHEHGWTVKKLGTSKGHTFDTQCQAISIARDRANRDRTELFIHGRDGRIRERNSFA